MGEELYWAYTARKESGITTMTKYILDGHKVVRCDDMIKWSQWFATGDRQVALTEKDGIRVSTVFLGLDHGWGKGKPVLFETMIFGGPHDENMYRYHTWEEAEAGHKEMCKQAFGESDK